MGFVWSDQHECLVHCMWHRAHATHGACHVPEHSPQQEHSNEKSLGQLELLSNHGTRIHLSSHEVLLKQHIREIVCMWRGVTWPKLWSLQAWWLVQSWYLLGQACVIWVRLYAKYQVTKLFCYHSLCWGCTDALPLNPLWTCNVCIQWIGSLPT